MIRLKDGSEGPLTQPARTSSVRPRVIALKKLALVKSELLNYDLLEKVGAYISHYEHGVNVKNYFKKSVKTGTWDKKHLGGDPMREFYSGER